MIFLRAGMEDAAEVRRHGRASPRRSPLRPKRRSAWRSSATRRISTPASCSRDSASRPSRSRQQYQLGTAAGWGPATFRAVWGILLIDSRRGPRSLRSLRLPGSADPAWKWRSTVRGPGQRRALRRSSSNNCGLALLDARPHRRREQRRARIPAEGSRLSRRRSSPRSPSACSWSASSCSFRSGPVWLRRAADPHMELINHLALGFGVALTPINLLYALIGVLLGTLIGVLPGIGPVATIAMLLPTTYALEPVSALIMLAGIYYGAQYGGSTTSILHQHAGRGVFGGHVPRRPPDGPAGAGRRRACDRGAGLVLRRLRRAPSWSPRSRRRCRSSRSSSAPAEYFSLMVLGLIGAVVLAHGSLLKAIAMIVLGLLLGHRRHRRQLGRAALRVRHPGTHRRHRRRRRGDGPVRVRRDHHQSRGQRRSASIVASEGEGPVAHQGAIQAAWPAVLRGTGLGSVLGLLPGGGAMLASFASYALEKKVADDPSRFGKGAIQGVAGPESANNAGAQTSFIPLLTLGHPGERRDGADGRRDDDPQHPARAAGDDEQSRRCSGASSRRCGSAT